MPTDSSINEGEPVAMNTYSIDRILKELDIAVKDHYDCLFGILKFCILDESQDKNLLMKMRIIIAVLVTG